jgi:succinate dehydrogenase / fumarate reductase, cytochrome b subunit
MGVLSFVFSSSLGRKLIMAVTGISLIAFLVVHCAINATVFFNDGGETFNKAADFMAHNWFIRASEIGLFLGLLWHIIQGLWLTIDNRKKRKNKYGAQAGSANSTWYSRSMGLLGSIVLIFLVMHLKHFWVVSRFSIPHELEHATYASGAHLENLYVEMVEVFANPVAVIVYVLGCIGLAYHLLHGFGSAFQTLGINHKSYTPIIHAVGMAFSILVPLIFAIIPVVMHLQIIK